MGFSNPDELSKFINIIEEYILAELVSPDHYMNIVTIMEEKYEMALKVSVPTESVFNLKSALLSLMATLLLIVLRQNNFEPLKIFHKMLAYLLNDMMNDFMDSEFKSIKAFKVSMLTLMNRFIIVDLGGFIDILNSKIQ